MVSDAYKGRLRIRLAANKVAGGSVRQHEAAGGTAGGHDGHGMEGWCGVVGKTWVPHKALNSQRETGLHNSTSCHQGLLGLRRNEIQSID